MATSGESCPLAAPLAWAGSGCGPGGGSFASTFCSSSGGFGVASADLRCQTSPLRTATTTEVRNVASAAEQPLHARTRECDDAGDAAFVKQFGPRMNAEVGGVFGRVFHIEILADLVGEPVDVVGGERVGTDQVVMRGEGLQCIGRGGAGQAGLRDLGDPQRGVLVVDNVLAMTIVHSDEDDEVAIDEVGDKGAPGGCCAEGHVEVAIADGVSRLDEIQIGTRVDPFDRHSVFFQDQDRHFRVPLPRARDRSGRAVRVFRRARAPQLCRRSGVGADGVRIKREPRRQRSARGSGGRSWLGVRRREVVEVLSVDQDQQRHVAHRQHAADVGRVAEAIERDAEQHAVAIVVHVLAVVARAVGRLRRQVEGASPQLPRGFFGKLQPQRFADVLGR